jgi:hypothetical protein
VAQKAFEEGDFALNDAFLSPAKQFVALVAQGALAHEGEPLDLGIGAEAVEAFQGLWHRG